jgi:serine/threonine protein kinase
MNICLQANVIILEYAELGSMKEYLKNNENIELKKLMNYAEQVALALQYIAERKYVHRDVAARNVLVFSHDLVKLSDFGLAKHLNKNNDYYKYYISNKTGPMPTQWYPPEVLRQKKFSEKSGKS